VTADRRLYPLQHPRWMVQGFPSWPFRVSTQRTAVYAIRWWWWWWWWWWRDCG